jgi:hypothetical protein
MQETRKDVEALKARVKLLKLALELAEAELIRARYNDLDTKLQENC